MRFLIAMALLAALGCASAAPAAADPMNDLLQMRKAFAALHSVHLDLAAGGMTAGIDMVAPNKFRETLSNGMQIIKIGADSWSNIGGHWMKSPYSTATLQTQIDIARNAGFESEVTKDYAVTDAGASAVGGIPAHKYRVVDKQTGHAFDIWVGMNHLPVQVRMDTKRGPAVITYSRYNALADITAPM